MHEERQSLAATGQPLLNSGDNSQNLEAMLSDDKVNALLESQAELNQ